MKIYLKTPFFDNSKTIPHILEHGIFQSLDLDIYFKLLYGLQGAVYEGYTVFDDIKDVNLLLKLIKQFPSKETLDYEIKIIKKEFQEISYGQKMSERIGKILYGKEYRTNSFGKYSLSQLKQYHQRYFYNPKYILTDDDYNILEINNIDLINSKENNISKPSTFDVSYKGYTDNISCWKLNNIYEYYFVNFIFELLGSYNVYFNRHKAGNYNYYNIWYHQYSDYSVISIPSEYKFTITEEFFEKFKFYFIKDFENREFREIKIIAMILWSWKVDVKKIKEFISDIEYKSISIIGNIEIEK